MNTVDVENNIEILTEKGFLSTDFKIDEILYENENVKAVYGHSGDRVYQWDEYGIGYISIGKEMKLVVNENGDLICADAFIFEKQMHLNFIEGFSRGICRICGCTIVDPCWNPDEGFCSWVDNSHTICSHCWDDNIENDERTIHCVNSTGKEEFKQYK